MDDTKNLMEQLVEKLIQEAGKSGVKLKPADLNVTDTKGKADIHLSIEGEVVGDDLKKLRKDVPILKAPIGLAGILKAAAEEYLGKALKECGVDEKIKINKLKIKDNTAKKLCVYLEAEGKLDSADISKILKAL